MKHLLFIPLLLISCQPCFAEISLDKIAFIESSHNPDALGDYHMGKPRSVGLYQISAGLLADYNKAHKTDYYHVEMRSPDQAEEVADWSFKTYFPRILKSMGKKVTEERLIVCWNAGCGALDYKRLPPTTKKYLRKYKKGA